MTTVTWNWCPDCEVNYRVAECPFCPELATLKTLSDAARNLDRFRVVSGQDDLVLEERMNRMAAGRWSELSKITVSGAADDQDGNGITYSTWKTVVFEVPVLSYDRVAHQKALKALDQQKAVVDDLRLRLHDAYRERAEEIILLRRQEALRDMEKHRDA